MSYVSPRGVFLQKLGPGSLPDPQEVIVMMQFALKEERWDAGSSAVTTALLDSTTITAVSRDGGKTFRLRNADKDIDGDGDIDANDQKKLLALAKAYVSINNP